MLLVAMDAAAVKVFALGFTAGVTIRCAWYEYKLSTVV